MSRELIIVAVLISLSTVLKICSVVALFQTPVHLNEFERIHLASPQRK